MTNPTSAGQAKPEASVVMLAGANCTAHVFPTPARHQVRFILDWLLNYAGVVCPAFTAIALIPIMVRGLGPQAYGLWITAITITTILGNLDLGLGWAITREAGAARNAAVTADKQKFIQLAANVAIVLAAIYTAILMLAAIPLSEPLKLAPSMRNVAPAVFFLAGIAFLGDWLIECARSVLVGLGRFSVIAALIVSGTLLRAVGVAFLLYLGRSLIPVAAWWAACQLIMAVLSLAVVERIEPRYSFRLCWPRWHILAPHLPFSLTTLLSNSLYNFLWQMPVLVVPLLRGSAGIVPYYLGQKFPMAALSFTHSGGDVLYAAASAASHSPDRDADRLMLRAAFRWNALVVFPLLVGFAIFAPVLFHVWLGQQPPGGAIGVARLATMAAFVDSLIAPILYFLWGRGLVRQTLPACISGAVAGTVVTLLLVPFFGVTGAAAGLLLGVLVMELPLIGLASRFCGMSLAGLVDSLRGFVIPGILCTTANIVSRRCTAPSNWSFLLVSALPPGLIFIASFYYWGASEGEREKVRDLLRPFAGNLGVSLPHEPAD